MIALLVQPFDDHTLDQQPLVALQTQPKQIIKSLETAGDLVQPLLLIPMAINHCPFFDLHLGFLCYPLIAPCSMASKNVLRSSKKITRTGTMMIIHAAAQT